MISTYHVSQLSKNNCENASNSHHSTPKNARVRAAYNQYISSLPRSLIGATTTKIALFQSLNIPKSSAYQIILLESITLSDRTSHN
jgi:hypothetical protein